MFGKLILSMVLMWFGTADVRAGQIHVLILADTDDGSIGEGIKENVSSIEALADEMKSDGFAGQPTIVSGANFSCAVIRRTVANLNIGPNDAVFIYYSGHGYRDKPYPTSATAKVDVSNSKFPTFDCRRSRDPADLPLSMAEVFKTAFNKQPRFVFLVSDACNIVLPLEVPPAPLPAVSPAVRKAGLRKLFFDYKGSLQMSGAVPGEFAWYLNAGGQKGGFFTKQLLSSLYQHLNNDGVSVTWGSIVDDSVKQIEIPGAEPTPQVQDPQAEQAFAIQ